MSACVARTSLAVMLVLPISLIAALRSRLALQGDDSLAKQARPQLSPNSQASCRIVMLLLFASWWPRV